MFNAYTIDLCIRWTELCRKKYQGTDSLCKHCPFLDTCNNIENNNIDLLAFQGCRDKGGCTL